jgi:hypothetical protein
MIILSRKNKRVIPKLPPIKHIKTTRRINDFFD